jgi:hypothetical protein
MHQVSGATVTPAAPRRRRGSRLAVLAVGLATVGAALLVPATASAATPIAGLVDGSTTCGGGAWPRTVQGMPAVRAGSAAGDYLWHDVTGWHLRVTHPGTTLVGFSGTIRANRKLHVRGYHLERGDTFAVSADGLSVTYRFRNHGRLDGLDFTTECATRLGFSGRLNGVLLGVRRIWIGRSGAHPLQNPFVIARRAA